MATRIVRVIFGAIAISASLPASSADDLCGALKDFLASVGPKETRELKFHTIVGSNFKDREEQVYGARCCDIRDHEPARPVCEYFMKFSSIESPGHNAKTAIRCISPDTRFAPGSWIHAISFATNVGPENDSTRVEVVLAEDTEIGGMALSIKAVRK